MDPTAPEPRLDALCDALADPGWVIVPDAVPASLVAALAAEIDALRAGARLRAAGVGRGATFQVRPEIRGDLVHWLDPADSAPPFAEYLAHLETLRRAFNAGLQAGLVEVEAHAAMYPRGTFYRPHLDRFADGARRSLSVILYLNDDWRAPDGGALRLYTEPGRAPARRRRRGGHVDVLPQAGTMVLFRSADFWHEVRRARRPRRSITGWFLTRPADGVLP
jgi:SM-20-related protein